MGARRFTPSLHPRGKGGRFTKRGGGSANRIPKSSSSRHGNVTIDSRRSIKPLTVRTTKKGNIAIYPLPMRTLETNAHIGSRLVGQTNTRVTRKGAVIEQVHVVKRHQGNGIAKAMIANQQKHLGARSMTASSFRSDDGERLTRSLQGISSSKRVVTPHTAHISKNIADSFAAEQDFYAWQYRRNKAKALKQQRKAKARVASSRKTARRQ